MASENEGGLDQALNHPWRSCWVREPGLRLYVRRPPRGLRPPGVDLDLAALDADEPGRGALTRFLDRYEPRFGFYVENVLNERLVPYLERRGYRRREIGLNVCLWRERPGAAL